MPTPGPMELILILAIVLLLFGFKKLPEAARSLGKSARVFKAEVNEMKEEDRVREEAKRAREGSTVTSTTTTTVPTTGTTPVRETTTTRVEDGNAVIREDAPRTDPTSGPLA